MPITAQTLAVLAAGLSLGSRAGAASQLLYVFLGGLGMPFFSGARSGWEVVAGPTGGYLLGFVAAAALVGAIAERHPGRIRATLAALVAGNAVVYLAGVPWLAAVTSSSLPTALQMGLLPFVAADMVKAALLVLMLPAMRRGGTH